MLTDEKKKVVCKFFLKLVSHQWNIQIKTESSGRSNAH